MQFKQDLIIDFLISSLFARDSLISFKQLRLTFVDQL